MSAIRGVALSSDPLTLRLADMRPDTLLLSVSCMSLGTIGSVFGRDTFEARAAVKNPFAPFQVFGNATIGPELTVEHLFFDQVSRWHMPSNLRIVDPL